MASAPEDTERFIGADDPMDALRSIGVALYDPAVVRPWLDRLSIYGDVVLT